MCSVVYYVYHQYDLLVLTEVRMWQEKMARCTFVVHTMDDALEAEAALPGVHVQPFVGMGCTFVTEQCGVTEVVTYVDLFDDV